MKLIEAKLFRYSLPFKSPLALKSIRLYSREGLIIQLTESDGVSGLGEIAPLPGFCAETFSEAQAQLISLIPMLMNKALPDDFSFPFTGLDEHLGQAYPSVRFGIESAVVAIAADKKNRTLSAYLNNSARPKIFINGLLNGSRDEILKKASELKKKGFKAVKLKVGSGTITEDIELTKLVRRTIGRDILLRLDSNRSWSLDEAEKFCNGAAEFDIEYLEEPLKDMSQFKTALNKRLFAIPIAIDETLREISWEDLDKFENIKAIVIKPTWLGLFESLRFAKKAQSLNITPVVSSAFESGLGINLLVQIAAAIDFKNTPMGLDTSGRFADDVLQEPLTLINGAIDVNKMTDTTAAPDFSLLQEVAIS